MQNIVTVKSNDIETLTDKAEWIVRRCDLSCLRSAWAILLEKAKENGIFELQLRWNRETQEASCMALSLDWYDLVLKNEEERQLWRANVLQGLVKEEEDDDHIANITFRVKWDLKLPREPEMDDFYVLEKWASLAKNIASGSGKELKRGNALNALHVNFSRWFQWFNGGPLLPLGLARFLLECSCFLSEKRQEYFVASKDDRESYEYKLCEAMQRVRHVISVRLGLMYNSNSVFELANKTKASGYGNGAIALMLKAHIFVSGRVVSEQIKTLSRNSKYDCHKKTKCTHSVCPWMHPENANDKPRQVVDHRQLHSRVQECSCGYFSLMKPLFVDECLRIFLRPKEMDFIITVVGVEHIKNDDVCDNEIFWVPFLRLLENRNPELRNLPRNAKQKFFDAFSVNLGDWETTGSYACHLHIHADSELKDPYKDVDMRLLFFADRRRSYESFKSSVKAEKEAAKGKLLKSKSSALH